MILAIMFAFRKGVKVDLILSRPNAKPDSGRTPGAYGHGWTLEELVGGWVR